MESENARGGITVPMLSKPEPLPHTPKVVPSTDAKKFGDLVAAKFIDH